MCITLWQPWASWITIGLKQIETRTHAQFARLVGHRIGIHAGKRWDPDAIGIASQWLTLEQQHQAEEFKAVSGVIVCTAFVRSHHRLDARHSERALIDCSRTKRFGLFLQDVQPVSNVPARGEQGIWQFPGQLA